MSPEPGVYVHVPFCAALCPYCDFAVHLGHRGRQARFVGRLLQEIERSARPFGRFDTLYFGGGTPSILESGELGWLIAKFSPESDCRLFLEANPEDVTRESAASWRALGIDTLSLGVQSLDAEELRFLGRRHSAVDVRRAIDHARDVSFHTVSVDLIYALPGQTRGDWRRVLEAVLELEPDHLSCYQLTVHDRTLFGRRRREGRLSETPLDEQADLFRFTHEFLTEQGYQGYEVSNFARAPEHRSRHNTKYWEHAPYFGFGPAAHSFDGRKRWWNVRSFFEWERRLASGLSPMCEEESLDDVSLLLETLMLRFRTSDGLDVNETVRRFGSGFLDDNGPLLSRLEDRGLVRVEGDRIRPTLDGMAVADSLARDFTLAPRDARTH